MTKSQHAALIQDLRDACPSHDLSDGDVERLVALIREREEAAKQREKALRDAAAATTHELEECIAWMDSPSRRTALQQHLIAHALEALATAKRAGIATREHQRSA